MFKDFQRLTKYIASLTNERDKAIFNAEWILIQKKKEYEQAKKDLETIVNYYNKKLGVV